MKRASISSYPLCNPGRDPASWVIPFSSRVLLAQMFSLVKSLGSLGSPGSLGSRGKPRVVSLVLTWSEEARTRGLSPGPEG